MPLTIVQAKQAKPKTRQYKIADGDGLYLLVKPNGGKYWRMKYRARGREKMLAFGTLDDVSVADARSHREQARKQIAEGKDPMEVRRLREEAAEGSGRIEIRDSAVFPCIIGPASRMHSQDGGSARHSGSICAAFQIRQGTERPGGQRS